MSTRTGAHLIYNFIKKKNISHVFGYTGGAILPVTDMFHEYNNKDVKYIKNINELCVGHSAEGYAKVTNKPGIILTTSGPGVTNLITPLQNALSDGTPLIAMGGQVSLDNIGTDAFQECPSMTLTKPCTKWNYRITDVSELPDILEIAYEIAMNGRKGPVFIDLPKNVVTDVYLNPSIKKNHMPYKNEPFVTSNNITDFISMLNKAQKPIIYIGQGAKHASDEIRSLIDILDIPFTSTLHGVGIAPESHPNSLDMLGMHGSYYANQSIQESDMIIAIGSRFDDRTTGNLKHYAPKAFEASRCMRGGVVHFDIEAKQINKVVKVDLKYVGDCKPYLQQILAKLTNFKPKYYKWLTSSQTLKKNNPFYYEKSDNKLKCQEVIEKISHLTSSKSPYITTGVGNHQMYCAQFYQWNMPGRMITSGSLGTMGFGLPSAIGVQLAKPNELVILIDGDGSFGMTMNDLSTIAEHNLPIKMFIMNDHRQQMVHIWQKLFFNSRFISTDNHNPDFSKIAEAYGIKSFKLGKHNLTNLENYLEEPGPILFDCDIEPDICLPLVAPGAALDDVIYNKPETFDFKGEAPC